MTFEIKLTDADKAEINQEVVRQIIDSLKDITVESFLNHLYTVEEAALQLSYSSKTILRFMHEGVEAPNGKRVYLKFIEPSPKSYRISRAEVDKFLSHF